MSPTRAPTEPTQSLCKVKQESFPEPTSWANVQHVKCSLFDIEMCFSYQEIGHHVISVSCYSYVLESISQSNGEIMLVQVYFDNHIQKLVTEAGECHQF